MRAAVMLISIACAAQLISSCFAEPYEFQCGTLGRYAGGIRQCDSAGEVCVCATGGCAVAARDGDPDFITAKGDEKARLSDCSSGLRYRRDAYGGAPEQQGRCVERAHSDGAVATSDKAAVCEPTDGAVDGTDDDSGEGEAEVSK